MEFEEGVYHTTDSVFFSGANRTTVAALAVAVALRTKAPVIWLDVRDPSGREDDYEPLLGPRISPDKRFVTRTPDELRPEIEASNLAVWTLVRADEPTETASNLIDFLRLPTPVQNLASEMVPKGGWAVLLVSNADRLAPLYPEEVESTRGYTETLKRQGIKVVSSFCGPERKDRFAYDHVYRVDGAADGIWDSGTIRREKGPTSESESPKARIPVAELALLAPFRVLSGRG